MADRPRPLVLIGTGRCGSTAIHRLLSDHAGIGWLSQLSAKYPARANLNRSVLNMLRVPAVRTGVRKWISPAEAYTFWDHYYPGFSRPLRDLRADDLADDQAQRLRRALLDSAPESDAGLMIKITGWPRISFIKRVLPEARFVHILRDGRAVANSLLRVPWWSGWQGPENWRWGELSDEQRGRWETADRSFAALAGLQWEILVDRTEEARAGVEAEDYLEIRYETACDDIGKTVEEILAFAGYPYPAAFRSRVSSFQMKNANAKWQTLSRSERLALEITLAPALRRHGYRVDDLDQ